MEATVTSIMQPSQEQEMKISNELIKSDASSITITNDTQYQETGDFARSIKSKIKTIKDYFAPMKEGAHRVHREICNREKAMLDPLVRAESICKANMSDYLQKKQDEAKKQAELMRRIAKEEAEKMLEEAMKAESDGNAVGAEIALAQATVAEQMSATTCIAATPPKANGISTSKDYEIAKIDAEKVPIRVAGYEIRPVDTKAIMRLIKASDGQIEIPGVTYRETIRMSVSSGR